MTKFEHLPNELIFKIFTYCYPDDLFIALFNLNARLNILIYAQPLSIDFRDSSSKYLLDLYYKSILFHAREQIHTLKLSDRYGRMSSFLADDNKIPVDFETRKLILSQVKSLILCYTRTTSLYQISKYINNIEYLQVTTLPHPQVTSDYDQKLFKSLFEKTSLKRLYLDFWHTIVYDDDIGISTSLTHMTLTYCHLKDLARLLRRIPNIQKLDITCDNPPNIFSDDYNGFDSTLFDGLAACIPCLTVLKLKISHIPFNEVETFLRQLPQLIKLTLSSLTMENYSSGSNWERIINNYLPNLQKFSLFIDANGPPDDTPIDLHEIIQPFNSFFWHRWPVVIEYYVETIEKRRLLLYTLPVQVDYLPTYLYRLQICTNIAECSLNTEKSYYKKVDRLEFIFHEHPSSRNLLLKRIYSSLEKLSFSFQFSNPMLYETDTILADFQQIFSISVLAQIEAINLCDQIYPINFVSNLLKLFPNITRLELPASALDLSITLPFITSLSIIVHPTIEYDSANILRQISIHFPDISALYFELLNDSDIYILLPYCLRKLTRLFWLDITFDQSSPCIDQKGFIVWFNDYKQLNGLSDDVEVEFHNDKHNFRISL